MKICVAVESMVPPSVHLSGAKAIYQLIKLLAKKYNLEIHVITSIGPKADPSWRSWFKNAEKDSNIHFHYVDLGGLGKSHLLNYYLPKIALFLKAIKLNKKFSFDIIHEYSASPFLCWRTSMYPLFTNCCRVHTIWAYGRTPLSSFHFANKRVINSVDRFIYTTKHMRQELLRRGIREDKVSFLPLGVNVKDFSRLRAKARKYSDALREKRGISTDDLMVLYVGPFVQSKGIYTLLDAIPLVLKSVHNTKFLIVCYDLDDERRKFVHEKLGLYMNSVILIGGKQPINEFMATADVFAFPLTTIKGTMGYPLTLLEAMASGKAIVASDVVGVREILRYGKGILVKPNSPQQLASALIKLLSSPKLRLRLGRNATRMAMALDLNNTAKRLFGIYEEITSNKEGTTTNEVVRRSSATFKS